MSSERIHRQTDAHHYRDFLTHTQLDEEVLNMLTELRKKHKNKMKKMARSSEQVSMADANAVMKGLLETRDVNDHVECVKRSRREQLQMYERRVETKTMKNKNFAEI